MKNINLFILLVVLFIFSCQNKKKNEVYKYNKSKNGIVSSGHPLASKAGIKMIQMGGNAFDAAVATAFALSVVEPSMSGIGGRMQVIFRIPNGEIRGIDASTQVPKSYDSKTHVNSSYGYSTIGIPGVVAGLIKLNKEYGKLSLKTVMEPAIKYAMEGFYILSGEANRHAYVESMIKEFKGTKKYFINKTGKTYIEGDLFIQKDLSITLKEISKNGHKGFYEGEIANKIVEDMTNNGGLLSLEDLKNYKAEESKILSGKYRGFDVSALYLPSYGAITIEILNILDNIDIANISNSKWVELISKVSEIAYKDRSIQSNIDSLNKIISIEYAKSQANKILENKEILANHNNLNGEWVATIGHTTHLTTADKNGNVVSLTQTIGPLMGSKVASEGLGFLYAVTLGGYLGDYKPGDRANSHISPTILSKNNDFYFALGAAGGARIITAITQVISNVIDKKMNLLDALSVGRIYTEDDTIEIENHNGIKWNNNFEKNLNNLNIKYKLIPNRGRFGRVHAVKYDTLSKSFIGAADPDWEGSVEVY